jgi:hypothetical protein
MQLIDIHYPTTQHFHTGSIPPEALARVDEARGMVELASREAAAAAAAVAAVSQVSKQGFLASSNTGGWAK